MSVFVYVKTLVDGLRDRENGASLVEYALLVALIAIVAVVAVAAFGGSLSSEYSDIADSLP
ncbi:MAG: Flp family type IVb pilin [Acidimicrobiia bacterium]|nr:Flp family type IVb pilin [Acidimicrobiia bacterium]